MRRPRPARAALATVALGLSAAGVLSTGTGAKAATLNQELAAYAKTLQGVRYVYGGTSRSGFDCSGLTQYVYRHYGKSIARTAQAQFRQFHRITRAQARPGDLIFFHDSSNPGSYVYHVGVFEGGSYMVAASTSAGRVRLQSYTWAGNTVTFGTISHLSLGGTNQPPQTPQPAAVLAVDSGCAGRVPGKSRGPSAARRNRARARSAGASLRRAGATRRRDRISP